MYSNWKTTKILRYKSIYCTCVIMY
jgi:hypothetical protein